MNYFLNLPNELQEYILHMSNVIFLLNNFKIIESNYDFIEILRYWFKKYYKNIFSKDVLFINSWFKILQHAIDIQLADINKHNKSFVIKNLELYLKYNLNKVGIKFNRNYIPYFKKHTFDSLIKFNNNNIKTKIKCTNCLINNYKNIIGDNIIDPNVLLKCMFYKLCT